MVRFFGRVEVVPRFVVNRKSHGRRVTLVQVVVLLRLLKRVRVINVRVVVKTLPISGLSRRSRRNLTGAVKD